MPSFAVEWCGVDTAVAGYTCEPAKDDVDLDSDNFIDPKVEARFFLLASNSVHKMMARKEK